jgi:hypothetical protein
MFPYGTVFVFATPNKRKAMTQPIEPEPIYANGRKLEPEDKAGQLRQLALIGLAARDSNMNLMHIDEAFQGLFEVMHRLAGEVEEEIAEMQRVSRRVA